MTADKAEAERAEDRGGRQRVESAIGGKVLDLLGRPAALRQVQVRRLWQGHYRVNVLIGEATFAEIAHSYFISADGEGKILTCAPEIRKQY